jgi:hypothetical protein
MIIIGNIFLFSDNVFYSNKGLAANPLELMLDNYHDQNSGQNGTVYLYIENSGMVQKYQEANGYARPILRKQGKNEKGEGYGWEYIDEQGNWHHTSTLNPKNKDIYNDQVAKDTHIQLKEW